MRYGLLMRRRWVTDRKMDRHRNETFRCLMKQVELKELAKNLPFDGFVRKRDNKNQRRLSVLNWITDPLLPSCVRAKRA